MEDGKHEDDSYIKTSEMESIFADMRTELCTDLTNSIASTIVHTVSNKMEKMLSANEAKNTRKFQVMETLQNEFSARLDAQAAKQEDLIVQINGYIKAQAISEQYVAEEQLGAMQWDAEGDPTKLKVSAVTLVTKASIAAAIIPWLTEVDCQEAASVHGPEVAKFFSIAFTGADRLHAARRAAKAFRALKDENHKWREFYAAVSPPVKLNSVPSADGPGAPIEAPQTRFYINIDKSPKRIFTDGAARRLVRACRTVHPNGIWKVNSNNYITGATLNGQRVARVKVDNATSKNVVTEWNTAAVIDHGINKDKIMEVMAQESLSQSNANDITWGL